MSILFEVYLHKLGFLFALKCFWIKVDLLYTNDMFSAIRAEKRENQASTRDDQRICTEHALRGGCHKFTTSGNLAWKTFYPIPEECYNVIGKLGILVHFCISSLSRIHLVTNLFEKAKIIGCGHGRARRLAGSPTQFFVPNGDIPLKRACFSACVLSSL